MNELKEQKTKNSIIDYSNKDNDVKYDTTSKNESGKKSKKSKALIVIIILISIIVLLLLGLLVFNIASNKVFGNVTINGISVSQLSKEEAVAKLEESFKKNLNTKLTLKYDDMKLSITPADIDGNYDFKKAVETAYSTGRYKNIFSNNLEMVMSYFSNQDIPLEFTYNQEKLDAYIDKIGEQLPQLEQPSYKIEDDVLKITKGKSGIELKEDVLSSQILDNIDTGEETEITLAVSLKMPDTIDIEKIREEIYKEPKNAYYQKDPFKIFPHEEGTDLAISLESAQKLLETDKDVYEIKLAHKEPEITTNEIGSEAFPDLLAKFSTTYIQSKVNRTTNLKLASNKINGVVILPGETFSYNKTVGPRTVAAGFKEAGVYSGGEVVDGLGGGICQISSNLYNIVLLSNLEIVERENHQFLPGYVGAGRDATVVYGSLDFKFKNTRDYPVKIVSSVGNGYVHMSLYGTKQDNEYDVSIQTTVLSTIYPKTVYEDTTTLAEGKTKVKDSGQNGCKSKTYRVLKKNGKVVSTELLSTDTYSAMKKVVLRGVKKSEKKSNTKNDTTKNTTNETKNTVVDNATDNADKPTTTNNTITTTTTE